LIFLGSEEFPFKGVLDKLANRSFAQGTNAYTDVYALHFCINHHSDHTCYQLTTAGEEGFLRILPVFLDHVLFPTITDEGFYTEVHHINGENGEDAGVVYCEMQGSENTSNSLTHERTMEMLFSGSGYEFNTGGRVKNLRDLTVEKVREYHKQFYRPDNVIVIITGPVNAEKTIDALQTVEEKINTRKNTTPHPQPFTKLAPQLTTSEEKSIQFPSDDEEGGALVSIGWRACEWKVCFVFYY
jgi:Zn-dependent M16 (insulinase) family peptidase